MAMERSKQVSLFMWALVAGLLSQNLVVPVMSSSFEDNKNYYSPPTGSHGTTHHGSPPSHTPHHGTPSHGGGSYHPSPSTPSGGNCGTPPHEPTTPTPSTPSYTPPSTPSYTPTPSTPSYTPPSTPSYTPTPSTPSYTPPSTPSYTPTPSTPPTPDIVSPPTTPYIDPGTPSIPTPPFFPAPNSPFIGTCNYWSTHPTVIWGLLGWWGTTGNAFGVTGAPGFGASMSLQQALSNTRTDGLGALYREGTASWLNSMVNRRFPFTTKQVRDSFIAALHSDKAAAAQAQLFKLANEGHLKPRD